VIFFGAVVSAPLRAPPCQSTSLIPYYPQSFSDASCGEFPVSSAKVILRPKRQRQHGQRAQVLWSLKVVDI
jgi:hypothetical protein